MSKFFTSDWHLGSGYVYEVGHRPCSNIFKMNQRIIKDCNAQAKNKYDTVYHIGDFCNRNNDRGYQCFIDKAQDYLDKITANVVLIKGNHDENNKVPVVCDYLVTDVGTIKNVTLSHYPSFYEESKKIIHFKERSIHLCGHVHDSWKYKYDYEQKVLNINVGVDVWNFSIISESKLYKYIIDMIQKHKKNYKK